MTVADVCNLLVTLQVCVRVWLFRVITFAHRWRWKVEKQRREGGGGD